MPAVPTKSIRTSRLPADNRTFTFDLPALTR